MDVRDLLYKMYPSDPNSGLPAFSTLNADISAILDAANIDQINAYLSQIREDIAQSDVNHILKQLKEKLPKEAEKLIQNSLQCYFTHSETIKILRDGEETLFPNARSLPDFDTDLLEPVWMRHYGEKNGE